MITPVFGEFFKDVMKTYSKPRNAANWFFNEILPYITPPGIIPICPDDFFQFLIKGKANPGMVNSILRELLENK